METLLQDIKTLGEKYQAKKIVLFGSRARGDNHARSDIDLAIYGMEECNRSGFWSEIDDLPTLLKFDLVYVSDNTDQELIKNIEKDGVLIYEQSTKKIR
ncbi:nucleotidyltransferase domain-containing protein [Anaerotignum propionicum]|uniref:nucleotidyltransferase family protein n=1 Tax=Anaerotignum propionicum TaxID=28446 RepID=UPI0028A0F027|nr:nucleotidyltransferase domain-containing protein [Anaerotignum propionicum]